MIQKIKPIDLGDKIANNATLNVDELKDSVEPLYKLFGFISPEMHVRALKK